MLPTDSIWLQVGFDRRVDGGVELEALVAVHLLDLLHARAQVAHDVRRLAHLVAFGGGREEMHWLRGDDMRQGLLGRGARGVDGEGEGAEQAMHQRQPPRRARVEDARLRVLVEPGEERRQLPLPDLHQLRQQQPVDAPLDDAAQQLERRRLARRGARLQRYVRLKIELLPQVAHDDVHLRLRPVEVVEHTAEVREHERAVASRDPRARVGLQHQNGALRVRRVRLCREAGRGGDQVRRRHLDALRPLGQGGFLRRPVRVWQAQADGVLVALEHHHLLRLRLQAHARGQRQLLRLVPRLVARPREAARQHSNVPAVPHVWPGVRLLLEPPFTQHDDHLVVLLRRRVQAGGRRGPRRRDRRGGHRLLRAGCAAVGGARLPRRPRLRELRFAGGPLLVQLREVVEEGVVERGEEASHRLGAGRVVEVAEGEDVAEDLDEFREHLEQVYDGGGDRAHRVERAPRLQRHHPVDAAREALLQPRAEAAEDARGRLGELRHQERLFRLLLLLLQRHRLATSAADQCRRAGRALPPRRHRRLRRRLLGRVIQRHFHREP
mmetsp:Transcript_30556/g.70059  ORF Transcript_30556/g.70059 Transcript_30556/m.70059 type:complete len:552 (-) Transcript_30556:147-1802(-)